jgi:hypothetical protein
MCATVITTALVSPFMRSLPLEAHGLEIVNPDILSLTRWMAVGLLSCIALSSRPLLN